MLGAGFAGRQKLGFMAQVFAGGWLASVVVRGAVFPGVLRGGKHFASAAGFCMAQFPGDVLGKVSCHFVLGRNCLFRLGW